MRLISFLGTGDSNGQYHSTTYVFDGGKVSTNYIAYALSKILNPKEIRLIATDEAWSLHGETLSKALTDASLPQPERVSVPTGGDARQLWGMFGAIVDVIQTSSGPVLLDITHGFRMQPFFAAACIQYVQSVLASPPQIRVVYGEFRGSNQESPIWELTPFVEVLSWSRNLMMFLRTGQADEVVVPTKELGRELRKQWATTDRNNPQPGLENLGTALEAFGNDFTTVRTGSLLVGSKSSAQRLWEAIERTRDDVVKYLPALALVLDQVKDMVEPLRTGGARLSSKAGQQTLIALAKLYQKMGRYSEAISILREGWITLGAPPTTDQPGTTEFDNQGRTNQEEAWRSKTISSRSVCELRNDIQHAGFNKQPHDRTWFEKQLTSLLSKWEGAIRLMPEDHPE